MDSKLEQALVKIKKVLEKRPEVLAAYLYGSQAKGYARKGSDIDVAIMMDPIFEGDTYNYQFDLEGAASDAVSDFEVETILLDNMNYPLKYNASVGGRLLHSRDDVKRAQEEIKIQNAREDFGDFFEERLRYNFEGARRYLNDRS